MKSPLATFNELRDAYLMYLDSPFDLRYPDLVEERRALIDQDRRLYRLPLIEPVPAYPSSGLTFPELVESRLGSDWNEAAQAALAEFVTSGLFPAATQDGRRRELYAH